MIFDRCESVMRDHPVAAFFQSRPTNNDCSAMNHNFMLFTVVLCASCLSPRVADTMPAGADPPAAPARLCFDVAAEPAVQELSPEFCWFHPRAAAIPAAEKDGKPGVIMTLMKHLAADDHYSGLYFMRTDDLGQTWTRPAAIPELAWRKLSDDITAAVIDTTPGWHAKSGRLLVIGAKTLYTASGDYASLQTIPQSYETSYATWDPATDRWSRRRGHCPHLMSGDTDVGGHCPHLMSGDTALMRDVGGRCPEGCWKARGPLPPRRGRCSIG